MRAVVVFLIGACAAAQGQEYSLDLSGVTDRMLLEEYDPAWQPEYRIEGFAFQVDPGNGGQVGVWRGSGNPGSNPGLEDYSSFIQAGPPAGMPVRVCMKFIHRDDGAWVSTSHTPNDPDNEGVDEQHYEVAFQDRALAVYVVFADGRWDEIRRKSFPEEFGATYWVCMEERRPNNDPSGTAMIKGWLYNEDKSQILETIEYDDDGSDFNNNGPIAQSTNYRGFGAYWVPNQSGQILEWYVEPAYSRPMPPSISITENKLGGAVEIASVD